MLPLTKDESMFTNRLVLYVNGKRHVIINPDPEKTLLQFLRYDLNLTGTKLGCGEGGCGACTVMISTLEPKILCRTIHKGSDSEFSHENESKSIRHVAATSCLVPLCSLHGQAVTTVEGIGSTNTQLDIVQESIANANGSQCGFCTPGFVMSVYTLLRNCSQPTMDQMESAVAGNLCRCTGYRPILDGLRKLTKDYCFENGKTSTSNISLHNRNDVILQSSSDKYFGNSLRNTELYLNNNSCENNNWSDCPLGDRCCKNQKLTATKAETHSHLTSHSEAKHNSQELIFPSELSLHSEVYSREILRFASERMTWYRPATHKQLLGIWNSFPLARLVSGNTDLALQQKQESPDNLVLISTTGVREYKQTKLTENGMQLGAGLRLSEVYSVLKDAIEICPSSSVGVFTAIAEMLKLVGSKQIRDMATLGGHIAAASPVSDLNPILQVAGCTVTVISTTGKEHCLKLDDQFFIGNKQTCLNYSDIITNVFVPFSKEMEYIVAYKESRKKTNAISNVTAAMRVKLESNSTIVESVTVSISGLGSRTRMAVTTCDRLIGLEWNEDLLAKGSEYLLEELHIPEDSVGGRIKFRNILLGSIFFKFYLTVCLKLHQHRKISETDSLPPGYLSAVTKLSKPCRTSCQIDDRVDGAECLQITAESKSSSAVEINSDKHASVDSLALSNGYAEKERSASHENKASPDENKLAVNNVNYGYTNFNVIDNGAPVKEKIEHDKLTYDKDEFKTLKQCTPDNKNCSVKEPAAGSQNTTNSPEKVNESTNCVLNENSTNINRIKESFRDPVGQPLANVAARLHATGEALYIDDLPPYHNELHLALVVSTRAHADIISVDPSTALMIPGVVDYIDHRDIPGSNIKGHKAADEEIFRVDRVTCEGQAIGAIVAESKVIARRAARAVVIDYKHLEPILTIQQAIRQKSYIGTPKRALSRGNVEEAFNKCDHVIEGQYEVGGQKHFYMETQACLVVTGKENREVEVYSSTQSLTTLQVGLAQALDIDFNKVTCRVKRLGGGFGGKETNSLLVALPAAVASFKLNRPVRCILDRDEDMIIVGGRHPFLIKYKVGFSSTGMLQALDALLYSNGGYSFDVSRAVLEEAIMCIENSYYIPNIRVEGFVCKTNLPSSTAFRGFGTPQAVLICEHWMSEIADYLGLSVTDIREMNLYKEGDLTPYNQEIFNCPVRRCWQQVIHDSNYSERRISIDKFNAKNRWKKRGIAVTPVKIGINTSSCNDQAGALVHIYLDGSVLVTHGGVEMGQGLHTKMIQVASKALRIPVSKVYINETNIATVPNTSPTSASASSDLNGMAVLSACETLMERLEPYRHANPAGTFVDWVTQAYKAMINLSATGFYKVPDLCYNWDTNTGRRFSYFTAGAACSEVEIDCLTGEHSLLRTDIIMDVGRSLNPAIDIGQIEGAFIQGYGYYMLEEVIYSSEGNIQNKGPLTYRIPAVFDIPAMFNVSLLKGSTNPGAIHSSKGVGEPPLLLATSVFMAVRDAIKSSRKEAGISESFALNCPATNEQIRLALPSLSLPCMRRLNGLFSGKLV